MHCCTYLPDNVLMFAVPRGGDILGLLGLFLQVVDGDISICQPRGQHMRVVGVNIHRDDATLGGAQKLRVRRVFE